MGYLVLQSQDDKSFDVIDGQQRLTTLTLVVLAAMKNLQRLVNDKTQAEQNQRRIDQIRQTYIGYLDPCHLGLAHQAHPQSQQRQLLSNLPGTAGAFAAARVSRIGAFTAQGI